MEAYALPLGKAPIGCSWVYTVKVGLDGQVDILEVVWLPRGTLSITT